MTLNLEELKTLPSRGVHQARVEMSLTGVERCIELLAAMGRLL